MKRKIYSPGQNINRRIFVKQTSLGIGALGLGLAACSSPKQEGAGSPAKEEVKKLGVALVGLGNYATNQLAPALQHTEHCYLAGIVTGTKEKGKKSRSGRINTAFRKAIFITTTITIVSRKIKILISFMWFFPIPCMRNIAFVVLKRAST